MQTTIFKQRTKLNIFEILGLEHVLTQYTELEQVIFNTHSNCINFELLNMAGNTVNLAAYMRNNSAFVSIFWDNKKTQNFRLSATGEHFIELNEQFEYITQTENIFFDIVNILEID